MKQALIYVLGVWLTTVLGGPFMYLLFYYIFHIFYKNDGLFAHVQWIFGLFFSLPCLVVCLITVPLINLLSVNLIIKKVVITIMGATVLISALYYIENERFTNWLIVWCAAYGSVLLAAIWLYKLSD